MFWGATFLPPAVTRMSFLRSVMWRKPSSSSLPMSPVLSQPSGAEHGGRRLGLLVVALEDGLRAHLDLAVVGDPDLEARQRLPDRAEAVDVGPVRAAGGRALGEAVALRDADPDRVEELDDLLRERSAARAGHAEPAAERLADLAEDESVGEHDAWREPCGDAAPLASRRLTSRPIGSAQSMSRRFVPVAASKRGEHGGVHLLVDAGNARQERRAHLRERLGDAERVGEERDREADVRPEEQHQPPVVVREREVEEHHVVRAVVRLLHPVDDARHLVVVAVREHAALGRPGRPDV